MSLYIQSPVQYKPEYYSDKIDLKNFMTKKEIKKIRKEMERAWPKYFQRLIEQLGQDVFGCTMHKDKSK